MTGSTACDWLNSGWDKSALNPRLCAREPSPSRRHESTSSSVMRTSGSANASDMPRPKPCSISCSVLPREHLVEQMLHACQLVAGNLLGEIHLAVEHLAVFGDHHDERVGGRQRDERELLDMQIEHRRGEHDGQAVGKARQALQKSARPGRQAQRRFSCSLSAAAWQRSSSCSPPSWVSRSSTKAR